MNPNETIGRLVPRLFEDGDLLAVEKPAGIDVTSGPGRSAPGLVEILAAAGGQHGPLAPINRLSRYESGVLLLAKNTAVGEFIRKGLQAHQVEQSYVAIVLGRPAEPVVSVDPLCGASRGRAPDGRLRRPEHQVKQGRTGKPRPSEAAGRGGERRTLIQAIRSTPRRSLIRCTTTVENTHAIRAQLRAMRLRLLGDAVHDRSARARSQSLTCLHLGRIAFYHPTLKRKLSVTCRPPAAFDRILTGAADVERALRAALVRRLELFARNDTDALRLLSGNVEDLPGLSAEKFGEVVILQVSDERPGLLAAVPHIAEWYRNTLGVGAVYLKRFVKRRAGVDEALLSELHAAKPVTGEAVPEQVEIFERGLRFLIRPHHGFSVGLFLDHRDNRRRVRALAEGKRVLNLFAYTCGFSVAAAAGGASQTVSVDISPTHLDWGRANFDLNHLDSPDHQFVRSDALDFLKLCQRQEQRFDVALVDPPTFAHGRTSQRGFSIARDLSALIDQAVRVLVPGGTLMVSTNNRRLSLPELRERIQAGAGRRALRITSTPELPVDFAMDPAHARTIFAVVE